MNNDKLQKIIEKLTEIEITSINVNGEMKLLNNNVSLKEINNENIKIIAHTRYNFDGDVQTLLDKNSTPEEKEFHNKLVCDSFDFTLKALKLLLSQTNCDNLYENSDNFKH